VTKLKNISLENQQVFRLSGKSLIFVEDYISKIRIGEAKKKICQIKIPISISLIHASFLE